MTTQNKAQPLSLKESERQAYRLSTYQDGLHDIFWGFYMLLMSFSSVLHHNGLKRPLNQLLIGGIALLGVFVVIIVKKRVTVPRIGLVKFGTNRKKRLRRMRIVLWVTAGITLGLLLLVIFGFLGEARLPGLPAWLLDFRSLIIFGIFVVIIFGYLGETHDNPHLHLYGWLWALGLITSAILEAYAGLIFYFPLAAAGVAVMCYGINRFIRFLQDYPLSDEPAGL